MFVNTLTVDDKYSLLNKGNLTQSIRIHLPNRQQTFSDLFSAFLEVELNVEHFHIKDGPHSLFVSEITDCEGRD